jgi:AcrR family transcriptional regulator
MAKTRKRAGRPAATASAETRERILRAASARFAVAGYAHARNSEIAEAAGVTSAALYHYFDSKAALFAATYRHYVGVILDAYRAAEVAERSAVGKLGAMAHSSVALNREHPNLAGFFAIAPLEVMRHPEVAALVGETGQEFPGLFREVLEAGVREGELPKGLPIEPVVHLLVATSYGLSWFNGTLGTAAEHDAVVEAFSALLAGTLFQGERR